MAERDKRASLIREFLLEAIWLMKKSFVTEAAAKFGVTRQTIHRHLRRLVAEGVVAVEGKTTRRKYSLASLSSQNFVVPLAGLEEHALWRNRVAPLLPPLAENVENLWYHGFTEMVNNAIDHSGGSQLLVAIKTTAFTVQVLIKDDGIGIFKKIMEALGLEDERHAVLELSKGKLTTDPDNHTGEGVFFSSRMFDDFAIVSGEVHFSHEMDEEEDWIFELDRPRNGTLVAMENRLICDRTTEAIFDKFSADDSDFGFTRTVVPVRLARHGSEALISRSQAKRLLARVDRFRTVLLNFEGVDKIGQAFADEVFRVFPLHHPQVRIVYMTANEAIKKMIQRVLREKTES